jgi:hypothetical protein
LRENQPAAVHAAIFAQQQQAAAKRREQMQRWQRLRRLAAAESCWRILQERRTMMPGMIQL